MKLKKRKGNWAFFKLLKINPVLLILILVVFDQITKYSADRFLPVVCNRGVAFGIPGGGAFFSIFLLIYLLWIIKDEQEKYKLVALFLIFAGGLSNFVDRIFYGCVRDFIRIIDFFPVFNFADIFISVGVVYFVYLIILEVNE